MPKAFVDAYNTPAPGTTVRRPILLVKTMGGNALQHHALAGEISADDATLDELRREGMIAYEYTGRGSGLITPTPRGRETVEAFERSQGEEPSADLSPLLEAINSQATSENRMAWSAVRGILVALRDYWTAAGLSPHGIQLRPLLTVCPADRLSLFTSATARLWTAGT